MSTSLDEQGSPSEPLESGRRTGRGVVLTGAGLIAVQLAFRGWAVAGSWFQFDDFAYMSRVANARLGGVLLEPYSGHVMPGGMFLTWVNHEIAPTTWALPAAELLLMQGAASVGCLAFLVSAFGPRAGVLPPLTIYLFSVISLPAFIWWAAGVNQLPLQIAFFWGLYTHLALLRSGRPRYAVATMLVTLAGLAFYEKTLLLFAVFAIVTLGYFARGNLFARARTTWTRYQGAVLGYGAVAIGYTVFYALWALNFSPGGADEQTLGPAFGRMAVRAFATGIVGGPLGWRHPTDPFATAEPSDLMVVAACVALLAVGVMTTRARTRAKRAWLIPAVLLASDVFLVATARSAVPAVAEDYRYQTELAAGVAVALGLSLLPLLGAVESAEPRRPSAFFDSPAWVTAATVLVASLSLASSLQYALHWQDGRQSRQYFANVEQGLNAEDAPVPLVDVPVPDYMLWGLNYPENATSHVLRAYSDMTSFPSVATDRLFIIATNGEVAPVVLSSVRDAVPGPARKCGYRVADSAVRIPLNGPVQGGGWWVRIGYLSSGDSPVEVTAGTRVHDTEVRRGVHSLYFATGTAVRSIAISGLRNGVTMCTDEVTLGLPQPFLAR